MGHKGALQRRTITVVNAVVTLTLDDSQAKPWRLVEEHDGKGIYDRGYATKFAAECAFDLATGVVAETVMGAHRLAHEVEHSNGTGVLAPHRALKLARAVIALDDDHSRLDAENAQLRAEVARLQRACDEGLPRELIFCPACERQHVDGENGSKFATYPHKTHRCEHCGYEWPSGRWSFGVRDPLAVR